jgi:hypothetical protein
MSEAIRKTYNPTTGTLATNGTDRLVNFLVDVLAVIFMVRVVATFMTTGSSSSQSSNREKSEDSEELHIGLVN